MIPVERIVRRVQALMNDNDGAVYTPTVVMPYLNMAYDELQEIFEVNQMPVTAETSALIEVPIGTVKINPYPTEPFYPQNLVEVQRVWERLFGSTESYIPVTRLDSLPLYDVSPMSYLGVFSWNGYINFLGAQTAREVKIEYIKTLFDQELIYLGWIPQNGVEPYMYFKTAAFCSMFVGENETRAAALSMESNNALDRELGIGTKSRQQIVTRRRPFQASYRNRGWT